ncbi:ATP-binding protein [Streptomyces sp. NPDC054904]
MPPTHIGPRALAWPLRPRSSRRNRDGHKPVFQGDGSRPGRRDAPITGRKWGNALNMEERSLSSSLLPPPGGEGLSCAEVREAARNMLADLKPCSAGLDDVLTVVTELISNAGRHAGGATGFRITVRSGAVIVEVSDRSPSPPRLQPWAPDLPGGFGWRLINQLATTHVQIHQGGKLVTATLTAQQTGQC